LYKNQVRYEKRLSGRLGADSDTGARYYCLGVGRPTINENIAYQ